MKKIKAIFLMMMVVGILGILQVYACKQQEQAPPGAKQASPVMKSGNIARTLIGDSAAKPFTIRDLDGRYASFATVTIFDPTSNRTSYGTCVGLVTFDGRGHFTDKEVHSYDGTIVRDQFVGTYSVNDDGTGKMHFVGDNESYDYEFVISNGGNEVTFLVMLEIPGIVSQGTLKKQ